MPVRWFVIDVVADSATPPTSTLATLAQAVQRRAVQDGMNPSSCLGIRSTVLQNGWRSYAVGYDVAADGDHDYAADLDATAWGEAVVTTPPEGLLG